jgi:hypothetical protein
MGNSRKRQLPESGRKPHPLNFKLDELQNADISEALFKAGEITGKQDINHNLHLICKDWLEQRQKGNV